MELIKEIEKRPATYTGTFIRYAIFKCPFCNNEVQRPIYSGKRQKSCGCKGGRNNEKFLATKVKDFGRFECIKGNVLGGHNTK